MRAVATQEDIALVYLTVKIVWPTQFLKELVGQGKVLSTAKMLATDETAVLQVTDKERKSIRMEADG